MEAATRPRSINMHAGAPPDALPRRVIAGICARFVPAHRENRVPRFGRSLPGTGVNTLWISWRFHPRGAFCAGTVRHPVALTDAISVFVA